MGFGNLTALRRTVRSVLTTVALLAAFIVVPGFTQSEAAQAADLSKFDPGYIISDSIFFDKNSMTAAEIQSFLNSKVSSCRSGYTCLKDYTETTPTIGGNPMCGTYTGAGSETAAVIIYRVAQICGISPKTLLVTLQKEQGLVTDTWPRASQYQSAMGALCPDTAPCDSAASGFFKQVYTGAYLFKRYTQPVGTGSGTDYYSRFDLMYPVGQTSQILYNPNSACGSQSVSIQNQATHVLYVYTPYVPNANALAAGYSASGDPCSSYGNRNFYNYFTDWFGSTTVLKPDNTALPSVGGLPAVGQTLTANPGGWSSSEPYTLSYFWLRCTADTLAGFTAVPSWCEPIAGATGSTYVVSQADVGKILTFQIAATNSGGFRLTGARISFVTGQLPQATLSPSISGLLTESSTLTFNVGAWTAYPATVTYGYFWLRCAAAVSSFTSVPSGCSPISGANSPTYTLTSADVGKYITMQTAVTNSLGYTLYGAPTSTPVSIGVPSASVAPTVSGSVTVGSTLQANPGTWSSSPTFTYFWLRCTSPVAVFTVVPSGCTAISGANSASYALSWADLGKYVTVQIAATNSAGFTLAGAVANSQVAPTLPEQTAAPSFTGTMMAGNTLTASPGTWQGSPTISYFWLRCSNPVSVFTSVPSGCSAIEGANSSTYALTSADVGKYVTFQIAATNSVGFRNAGPATQGVVAADPNAPQPPTARPGMTTAPSVSGTASVGSTVTASPGSWTQSPTFTYFWLRCAAQVVSFTSVPTGCTPITGANASTYVITSADAGSYVTVQLAATNSFGFTLAGAATTGLTPGTPPSNNVTVATRPIASVAPAVVGAPTPGAVLTASNGTWSGSPVFTYFWIRCDVAIADFTSVPSGCSAIPGANNQTYTVVAVDLGKIVTVQIAATNSAGFTLGGVGSGAIVRSGLPVASAAPSISGTMAVGNTLSVSPGTWSGAPTFTYFWLRCSLEVDGFSNMPKVCVPIVGANSSTYTLTPADSGMYVTVQLAATNPAGFTLSGPGAHTQVTP